jgi:thymidine kinase
MFIEPHFHFGQEGSSRVSGWIEIITGCMFSGKTEELIRRLKRSQLARQKVTIFKPVVDTRYHLENIVSHNHNSIPSIPVTNPKEIILLAIDCEVVGIDEAQFFDSDLPINAQKLAMRGTRVIIAGLDMDFRGQPFGPIPSLLAVAEYITKVHAICPHCGNLATHSYRRGEQEETVVLGEKELYEPRCRTCYHLGKVLDEH